MESSATTPEAAASAASGYRAAERRFRRASTSDLYGVVDLCATELASNIRLVPVSPTARAWLASAQIFAVDGIDGFRVVRCPFSAAAQLEWARAALGEWAEPEWSVTNLDLHHGPQRGLWAAHRRGERGSLLPKLSWATLGYHYGWSERAYDPARRSAFPPPLARLAADLAAAACGAELRAEAAIVNFYGASAAMGGHRDDAEAYQDAPIVSISLGLDAVYLIGGETKEVAPTAIRLRSGDVVVQGGHSRGYYHGVPRVLAATAPPSLRRAAAGDAELLAVCEWLEGHRINLNVRQCFEEEPEEATAETEPGGGAEPAECEPPSRANS